MKNGLLMVCGNQNEQIHQEKHCIIWLSIFTYQFYFFVPYLVYNE